MTMKTLGGIQAALARRLSIGRRLPGIPLRVEIDDEGQDWELLREAMRENSSKLVATQKAKRREAELERHRQSEILAELAEAVRKIQAGSGSNGKGHEETAVPAPASAADELETSELDDRGWRPGRRRHARLGRAADYVGSLLLVRADRPDYPDRLVQVDEKVRGGDVLGRTLGGVHANWRVSEDTFMRMLSAGRYIILRHPGEKRIDWPAESCPPPAAEA